MTIKPIDMQTSIGQMHEVARNQHAQNESLISQMHHLDKESNDKSVNADSRLEESKDTEHLTNRLDEHKGGSGRGKGHKHKHEAEEKKEASHVEVVEDLNLGRFIDIKK